jgi:hypothetical protein
LDLDNTKEGKFKTLRKEDLQNIISNKKQNKKLSKNILWNFKNMKETKSLNLKVNNNKDNKNYIK